MKKYKHFIFDYDGVLCNSLQTTIEGYNEVRANGFEELPAITTEREIEHIYQGYLSTALNRWLSAEKANEFWNKHIEFMQVANEKLVLFEGANELIQEMEIHQMSIVTSASEKGVLNILSRADIEHQKIFRIAGSERKASKAENIKRIAEDLKLNLQEMIYIGDLENDILHCNSIGIDIICVGYGYHSEAYLRSHSPKYLVNSVEELRALIQAIK